MDVLTAEQAREMCAIGYKKEIVKIMKKIAFACVSGQYRTLIDEPDDTLIVFLENLGYRVVSGDEKSLWSVEWFTPGTRKKCTHI